MKEQVIKHLSKHLKINKQEIEKLLEVPPTAELGDYAFPCFTLTKTLKKAPNQIAQDLSEKIKSSTFEKVEAKGPYINFFTNKQDLAKQTLSKILKEKNEYGSAKKTNKKMLVEFSQPNTHKAFHIGHVRGTALGESISRIAEFSGNQVVRANYSGDTGMHIAKWIWCYQKYHKKEKLKDDEPWIASIYVDAVKRLEANKDLQEEVNVINQKLDSKEDKNLNNFWKETRELSIKSWETIYNELNTCFDRYFFESEVEQEGKKLAQSLVKKKIAKVSEGATIIDFAEHNSPKLNVLVFLRKDGTALYAGKDLALAELKQKEFKPDKSIYVIGKAQELYINQIFKTLELMKSPLAKKSYYASLTEVRFPQGKMSSRSGDNVLYSQFKQELTEFAEKEIKKRHDIKKEEIKSRALAIAIASLKYTMLKQDTNKPIIFNPMEAIKFEGNTGPYLLYTYARARSIIRKAKKTKTKYKIPELTKTEKELIKQINSFPEIVSKSHKSLSPNTIANYTYQLSQSFAEFYHTNKVINSPEESFRLTLVTAFAQTLKNSLNLLGIETLESM